MCRYFAPIALAILAQTSGFALAQSPEILPAAAAQAVDKTPVGALTLGAALREALERHPDLAAARRGIEAAEGARLQAQARPNPVVDAQVEDLRRDSRTTTFTWSQPIEMGGKRAARTAVADRGIELARAQLAATQVDLQARVTAAFFSALIAQERLALAKTSLDVARRGSDAASKRVLAGKVSPVEETRALAAQASVQVELLQAQGELRNSLTQLRAAIGPGGPLTAVDGDALAMPALLTEAEVTARVQDSPVLQEALLEVRRLRAVVELERTKRTPDISVTLGAKRPSEPARLQAVIGISVPLPLFDTNRGNILEATKRQFQAEDVLRATELRIGGDAAAARQKVETAIAESTTLRDDLLPRAQSAFDAATKGFELGKFSYLEALDAQRTLLQARAQYLRALADAHQSSAELRRLLGLGIDNNITNAAKE